MRTPTYLAFALAAVFAAGTAAAQTSQSPTTGGRGGVPDSGVSTGAGAGASGSVGTGGAALGGSAGSTTGTRDCAPGEKNCPSGSSSGLGTSGGASTGGSGSQR